MFKRKKEELLKAKTIKFVANIIRNTRERMIRRHEMIKDSLELSIECRRCIVAFHDDIRLAVRVLNGLPILDDSFVETGVLPDDPLNLYAYKSILWRGSMKSEPVDSNIYKGRFIMQMLMSIDQSFDEMIWKEVEYRGKKKDEKECVGLIYQVRDCLGNFIDMLADNNPDYRDELLKVNELIVFSDNEYFKRSKKTLGVVSRELNRLDEMLHPGFLDSGKPSDDIVIQNVCLIAYVLATGSSNVKNTFIVPEEIDIRNEDDVKVMIEVLGNCILSRRVSTRPYPEIYKWFLHSLPKIKYKFKDINYNKSLAEGCRALSFVSFYSGSREIKKLIKKMIY